MHSACAGKSKRVGEMIRYLAGQDPWLLNLNNLSSQVYPLETACLANDLVAVSTLVELGAKLCPRGGVHTPLHIACMVRSLFF